VQSHFPPVSEQMDEIRRGALEIVPEDDLVRKLERSARTGKPLRVKQGFDPTRPDLHIGHAVSLRKLRAFQDLGHEVVFVVGDSTALIGDPTGRSDLRPRLTEDEVRANAATYTEQAFAILDAATTRVEFNSSWLAPLQLGDLLQLTAHYTVARMLERDDFARRYAEGRPISIVEFMYPLMQGYDSVALRADVEMGGSDQKFNLLVGRALQERYDQEPQVCVVMPLLRGTDGEQKMSKSYDNYIGLTHSPGEQYGRTMSIPDGLLDEWWRLAAGLPPDEVEAAVTGIASSPYASKRALAARIVAQYHGDAAAGEAAAAFDRLFRRREIPDDIPRVDLAPSDVESEGDEVALRRLMVRAGLAPSASQAVRDIEGGGVQVNGERITDRDATVATRGEHVLQKGKRHFARVVFPRS
jgi:tyrosyl-tRNA synthetase